MGAHRPMKPRQVMPKIAGRKRMLMMDPSRVFSLFDHLVGERGQPGRNLVAERFGGLQIDNQLEFCGLYNWQVGRLLTLENAAGVKSGLSVCLYQARSVTDEPARHRELTKRIHGRNRMACRECNELLNPAIEKSIITDEQRPSSCLDQAPERGVDFAVGACVQYLNL